MPGLLLILLISDFNSHFWGEKSFSENAEEQLCTCSMVTNAKLGLFRDRYRAAQYITGEETCHVCR